MTQPTKHRPPTASDIGNTVEVLDGTEWQQVKLFAIRKSEAAFVGFNGVCYHDCRVPYSTPDPVAELSIAADWLAERGMEEAARVLMLDKGSEQLGELKTTPRDFQYISFNDANDIECTLQQSSAIGDMANPGSSFVWLGRNGDDRMHLDRKQVRALVEHLRHWLKTGMLTPNPPEPQL